MVQRLGAVEVVAAIRLELETKFKLQHKLLNMIWCTQWRIICSEEVLLYHKGKYNGMECSECP